MGSGAEKEVGNFIPSNRRGTDFLHADYQAIYLCLEGIDLILL
jgi:hypothetical protein